MKSEAGTTGDAPAATTAPEEAGTSPDPNLGARSMKYFAESGTQRTHPKKPTQPNVMRYLDV